MAKVDLTNWFFVRLQGIYGSKYSSQFANKADLAVIKREWAEDICKFSREALDKKLSFAKASIDHENYRWPNIGAILKTPVGSPTGVNSAAYVDDAHLLTNHKQSSSDTAKAYSIINQLLAPNLMGTCRANAEEQKWAGEYVAKHWQAYCDVPMPTDIREIVHGLR